MSLPEKKRRQREIPQAVVAGAVAASLVAALAQQSGGSLVLDAPVRLPWVSRAAFDLSQRNNEGLHRLVIEHADARYDRLLTMYHELALRVSSPPVVSGNAATLAIMGSRDSNGPVPSPPIDATVDLWLDAKFVRGTPTWRQQRSEAMKLAVQGIDAERICDILARGQLIDL